MAKKTSNVCSCYYDYPNPNHNYCSEFIRIRSGKYCDKGYCIRRSALGICLKCLKLPECEEVLKIKSGKGIILFGCTEFEE